jgi:hypothetical protein
LSFIKNCCKSIPAKSIFLFSYFFLFWFLKISFLFISWFYLSDWFRCADYFFRCFLNWKIDWIRMKNDHQMSITVLFFLFLNFFFWIFLPNLPYFSSICSSVIYFFSNFIFSSSWAILIFSSTCYCIDKILASIYCFSPWRGWYSSSFFSIKCSIFWIYSTSYWVMNDMALPALPALAVLPTLWM